MGKKSSPRSRTGKSRPAAPQQTVPPTPCWNKQRRELWYDGQLVKRFRQPADRQEAILNAFQKAGWRSRIRNPLPRQDFTSRKEHLRETVKSLNAFQKHRRLHFGADGVGGVIWTPLG